MFNEEKIRENAPKHVNRVLFAGVFIGKWGQFYVRVTRLTIAENGDRFHDQTAVYPSIESYNTRSVTPTYVSLVDIQADYNAEITINMETLTVDVITQSAPPLPHSQPNESVFILG